MMAVGIYLDSRAISAVRLDGSSRNPEITRFVAEPMPKPAPDHPLDPFEFRAKVLEDFLRRHKIPRENAYLALDSEFCMHRTITVPFTADDQIRKTIRYQAEAHIHTTNIDEVEFTYKKLVQRDSTSDVLVNIIRRAPLRATLSALKDEGVDPLGVDTPFAAGANAFLFHDDAKLEEHVLWVDVGVASTLVALTHGGELLGVRLPKIGLDLPRDAAVEEHLAKTFGPLALPPGPAAPAMPDGAPRQVAFEHAAEGPMILPDVLDDEPTSSGSDDTAGVLDIELEDAPAGPSVKAINGAGALSRPAAGSLAAAGSPMVLSDATVLARPDSLVRRFVTELKRTMVSLTSDRPPTKLRLSGGGEAAGLLAEAVHEAFPHMEVVLLPPGMGLKVKADTESDVATRNQGLLKALGMALKGFGHNALGFEFRRGEFSVQDAFEAMQAPVTAAVMLLALLFGAVLVFANRNQTRVDALEARIYDDAALSYRMAYGDDAEVPRTTRAIYDELFNDFRRIERIGRRGEELPPTRSALDVWVRIQEAIERVGREEPGEVRSVPGYERGMWPRRDPERPYDWREEDKEKLELEWTVDRLDVREGVIEIRGKYVKQDGIVRLVNELERMTDLIELDGTGRRGQVNVTYGSVGAPGQVVRGNPVDHRGTYTIRASLQRPLPAARDGGGPVAR